MTQEDRLPAPDAEGSRAEELERVFILQRDRLRRTVVVRMDARLLGRLDPDDVLQESYLEAKKRVDRGGPAAGYSMFVWARMVVEQTMVDIARRHLGAKKRAVTAEIPLEVLPDPSGTGAVLTHELLSRVTSPTQAAARAEVAERLTAAIAGMSDLDREILLLRHFEELSNNETAQVLGIHKAAATNRYLRALRRLREVLTDEREDYGHGVA